MKPLTKIPLMYHPTNVLLIDDDPAFLNSMRGIIQHDIPYITNGNPAKALRYLKSHTFFLDLLSSLVSSQKFDVIHKSESIETFDVDFSYFYRELETAKRFKKITTVVIDQAMPTMSGLEFCCRVREDNLPIKLILLTGELAADEAVEAFNNGIIDAYIPKNVSNLHEAINEQVMHYSVEEFIDIGDKLLGFISYLLKPLIDEQFIQAFNQILQKHDIREFYLINSSCSFLMGDALGKAKMLIVRGESDFQDIYEFARDSEAPYDILQSIRDRQRFPFTRSHLGYLKLRGDAWEDAMESVKKIPGRELYYMIVERPDINIFSFQKYFNEVWPEP